MLRLEVDFSELVADLLAGGIDRVGLLVKIDGLVGVFRVAGDLVFLLIIMAHRVIVIGFGGLIHVRLFGSLRGRRLVRGRGRNRLRARGAWDCRGNDQYQDEVQSLTYFHHVTAKKLSVTPWFASKRSDRGFPVNTAQGSL